MNDGLNRLSEKFQNIGIYGVGLLGGSLGLALKKTLPKAKIVGIGRNEDRLEQARQCGAIDSWTTDPGSFNNTLDLLVLCTPVRLLSANLKETLPSLSAQAIVTDVGSTKAQVVADCEPAVAYNQVFVGSHPMAGSHKSGITAADGTLFQDRTCVVTPTENTPKEAVDLVVSLWKAIGMKVVFQSPEEHDALTAISSHLPHLTASALCHVANNTSPKVKEVIGTGFCGTTRIASGDPGIWVDICLENAVEINASINNLIASLAELQKHIQDQNIEGINHYLQEAKKFRDQFNNHK